MSSGSRTVLWDLRIFRRFSPKSKTACAAHEQCLFVAGVLHPRTACLSTCHSRTMTFETGLIQTVIHFYFDFSACVGRHLLNSIYLKIASLLVRNSALTQQGAAH